MVIMTGRALMALTVGLMGFLAVKILVSAFYAKQDTKFPVKIGVRVLILNVILSALFYKPLAHAGLALASALASLVNAGWLFYELWRRQVYRPHKGWGAFTLRLLLAAGVMAGVILFLSHSLEDWFAAGFKLRMLWLMSIVLGAGFLYLGSLWVFGMRRHHLSQRG
jgi:putative peptidoglycan lipid II flippase